MGLFSKKKDKIYPLPEAMKLLKMQKYEGYTTIPVGDGFKIVSKEVAKAHIEEFRVTSNNQNNARTAFVNQISNNGQYESISSRPNYNNYQAAKKHRGEIYIGGR